MTDSLNSISFSGEMTADIRYQGLSILIIDRELDIQSALFGMLSKFFTNVDCSNNIAEAAELCQSKHYDITILDIDFPERSSDDWHKKLRLSREFDNCVIFMASYAELSTAIDAMKFGACDFILKPFQMEQIISAVQICANKVMGRKMRYALALEKGAGNPLPPVSAFPNIPEQNGTKNCDCEELKSVKPKDERLSGYPDRWTLKEVEKAHILQVVDYHDGNKSAASKTLGVSRKTLERKFKDWDI